MDLDINGKMTKKLLNKTTSIFLLCTVCVLVLASPGFYYITDKLYLDETNETLELYKEEFNKYYLPSFTKQDIIQWNRYNRNTKILPDEGLTGDVYFDKIYYDELEDENEPYRELRTAVVIEGKTYTFMTRRNQIEKIDVVFATAIIFSIVLPILLIVVLLASKIISGRLWKPFYITLQQIENFEIDKNNLPCFSTTNIDEFQRLNSSLEALIKKNMASYNTQREFVENAAHELQTPLAVFQSKIDSMLQLDLNKEQSVVMGAINADVSRLNRLNKNLLLLSKIDNGNYLELQPLILNDYVKKNFSFFKEQAKSKNLSVITEYPEILKIDANPELVEVLINNLVLNAIRHNIKNGKIIITVANKTLTIINSGQNTALISEKLYNRFSKSNPSSSGNGLGLSIVKKIADLNQWVISYSFAEGMHTFTIKF